MKYCLEIGREEYSPSDECLLVEESRILSLEPGMLFFLPPGWKVIGKWQPEVEEEF